MRSLAFLTLLLFTPGAYAQTDLLKVLTLNVGHARADGPNQLLQSDDQAVEHLLRIADVLRREAPHVAALQEIDRNSFWNGRFDHTAFLADHAQYPHYFTGSHADGDQLDYGTALIAKYSLKDPSSVSFSRGFARPRKGFVLSTIDWPGRDDVEVDLVSVHLDFLSARKRRGEVATLVETLKDSENPKVVMGDLNSEYGGNRKVIPMLERELGLSTWQPQAKAVTFPRLRRRVDWVLVSPGLEIVSHEVLSDPISDHRAIVAELKLRDN